MIPATPGTRDETETETETEKNDPACDAATARWLFDAATRPESSRGVALGARDPPPPPSAHRTPDFVDVPMIICTVHSQAGSEFNAQVSTVIRTMMISVLMAEQM